MAYDIFISYRRNGGEDFTGRIVDHLKTRGYNPFMDLEAMKSGRFDSQLYKKIDECKHFLLILSPKSLERCKSESDWVRKEVEYALKNKKHIITIQMPGFVFPKRLPDSMEVVRYLQAVLPSPDTFDYTVDKVVNYIEDSEWKPTDYDGLNLKANERIKKKKVVNVLFSIIGIVALIAATLVISSILEKEAEITVAMYELNEEGEWIEEKNIEANVGDILNYRINVSGINKTSDPVLTLELDKSLVLMDVFVSNDEMSENGEKVSLDDLSEGVSLKGYRGETSTDVYVNFTVKVINYDLTMTGNQLYIKANVTDGNEAFDLYGVVNVVFFDEGINEDDLVTSWGDTSGGRDVYTTYEVNEDYVLGDRIVFNSIIDWEPIGDERNFVAARKDSGINAGANNIWHANEVDVTEEGTYLIRAYIHNDNPNGLEAIAKDVYAFVTMPLKSGTTLGISCSFESSNSNPSRYWDGVTFRSNKEFYLDYVEESTSLENNGIGANGGCPLRDSIITSDGIRLGYESLDGNIPGGAQYAVYITFKVKVIFIEKGEWFKVEPTVRKVGEKEWSDELEVSVGDELEVQVHYTNSSNAKRENVMMKIVSPESVEYIPDSAILYNTANPDGIALDDTVETEGINIGAYNIDADAYVRMRYTVRGSENNVVGRNRLRFWGQIDDGTITLQDSTDLILNLEK